MRVVISLRDKPVEEEMRRGARNAKRGGLDRRTLFRYGGIGAAAAVIGPSIGRAAAAPTEQTQPAASAAGVAPFALDEATIADLQKKMASGEESSRSLTQMYLARIEALDRKGPELRSVLETNPDAMAIAEKLDAERKAGKSRGPLH